MATCTFCGKQIEKGTGKMFIKNDGRTWYFCSTKCEKNLLKLKRKPRETKFTEEFRKIKKMRKEARRVKND